MTYQIIDQRENFPTTERSVNLIRDFIGYSDQAAAVQPNQVISTYAFEYEGGQRGQLTVYHSEGRAAIALGGDSDWGDWDNDNQSLRLTQYDDTHVWVVAGDQIWEESDVETDD